MDSAKKKSIVIDSINGIEDHTHCLLLLDPQQSVSTIIHSIKGESSHWVNEEKLLKIRFGWQEGYSCFSVSESLVPVVRKYISSQEEHHKKITFSEEVEKFLYHHQIRDDRS